MIDAHSSVCRRPSYPQGSEIPQRPSDPIGIQSMHFSLQPPGWSPLSWSCDCLLSVPSPGQPRAGEEHHITWAGIEEICAPVEWTVCCQTVTNIFRTSERDFHSVRAAACGKWSTARDYILEGRGCMCVYKQSDRKRKRCCHILPTHSCITKAIISAYGSERACDPKWKNPYFIPAGTQSVCDLIDSL